MKWDISNNMKEKKNEQELRKIEERVYLFITLAFWGTRMYEQQIKKKIKKWKKEFLLRTVPSYLRLWSSCPCRIFLFTFLSFKLSSFYFVLVRRMTRWVRVYVQQLKLWCSQPTFHFHHHKGFTKKASASAGSNSKESTGLF